MAYSVNVRSVSGSLWMTSFGRGAPSRAQSRGLESFVHGGGAGSDPAAVNPYAHGGGAGTWPLTTAAAAQIDSSASVRRPTCFLMSPPASFLSRSGQVRFVLNDAHAKACALRV